MTGYGASSGKVGKGRLYIEVKTINHRYCEISLRVPPRMGSLEGRVREYIQSRLKRGKIDVFLKELDPVFGGTELTLNVELARKYQTAIRRLQKELKLSGEADPLSLMGIDHFIHSREKEGNYASYWKSVQKILAESLTQLEKMRSQEGQHLLKDQQKRLKALEGWLHKIEMRSAQNARGRRTVQIANPSSGNMETNMAVDKMDITEETIRLKSHAKQYAKLLQSSEPVGRKLDFLIQEMHREINTIGAKAADADVSGFVVDCKSLLENLREQIQNLE